MQNSFTDTMSAGTLLAVHSCSLSSLDFLIVPVLCCLEIRAELPSVNSFVDPTSARVFDEHHRFVDGIYLPFCSRNQVLGGKD